MVDGKVCCLRLPGTKAMKSPSGSGNSSSFFSFIPTQAGSSTRMSRERILHSPSSARGYSPESHTE
jgi:hypothetical protein